MRWIVPITAVTALLALSATYGLTGELRHLAWGALGVVYLAICVWGTVDLGSGIFTHAVTRAPHGRPEVALTFDDGPDPASTPALLDLLAERGAKATFFLVGERARAHPELTRRIAAEGHTIGNHSFGHGLLHNLYPRWVLRREITACQEAIAAVTGESPRYYRPPFGLVNHALMAQVRKAGLELVGWQVRSRDTGGRTPEQVSERVLRLLEPGGIVLLHDGGLPVERVLAIAGGVLDGLAERGLQPVTLEALLLDLQLLR